MTDEDLFDNPLLDELAHLPEWRQANAEPGCNGRIAHSGIFRPKAAMHLDALPIVVKYPSVIVAGPQHALMLG